MSRTIIKTGVRLKKLNANHISDDPSPGLTTLYGDLHVIGNCCIVYFPTSQSEWGTTHGWIDLANGDGYWLRMARNGELDSVIVIPARRIRMRRDALHEWDRAAYIAAGGIIDETRGELG